MKAVERRQFTARRIKFERGNRTDAEQLQRLDFKLGEGIGAKREREMLQKRIQDKKKQR